MSISNLIETARASVGEAKIKLQRQVVLSNGTIVEDPSDVGHYNRADDHANGLRAERDRLLEELNQVPPSERARVQAEINKIDEQLQTQVTSSSDDDGSAGPNTSSAGHDQTVKEEVIYSSGEDDGDEDEGMGNVEVASFDLGEFGDSHSTIDLSAIPGDAEINFLGYEGEAGVIVSLGEDGVVVTLEGAAAAYIMELNYQGTAGPLGVSVEAMIGASVEASADFKINPMEGDFEIELQAGVVVGATVNANGELDLGYVTLEAGATGIAGLAADVNLDVGFDDWEFEFDGGAKLAVLLGGGFDASFSVDGKEIVADLGDAGKVVWDQSGNIIGGAVDLGEGIVNFGESVLDWLF